MIRPPHPGPWLLAKGVHVPGALVASALAVALFTVLGGLGSTIPLGMITSGSPLAGPVILLQPALVAIAVVPTLLSPAALLETAAARRVRAVHAALVGAVVALQVLAVAGQARFVPMPEATLATDAPSRVAALLGAVGLALLGTALLGGLGWVVPVAYALLVVVVGTDDMGRPAFWAWTLAPVEVCAPVAAVLLVSGCAAIALRWRRPARVAE